MRLYHVTTDIHEPVVKTFYPRVPDSIALGEDSRIPRICLSTSVANCIRAVCCNALRVGRVLRIYTTEVTGKNFRDFIPPCVLYTEGLVFDALSNEECWCLVPLKMESKLYCVYNFESEHAINWTCVSLSRMFEIVRKYVPTEVYDIYAEQSSEKMFSSATRWLEGRGLYNESDDLYEDVVADWHCHTHKITKLELKELPNDYAYIEPESGNSDLYVDTLRTYFYEY